MADAPSRGGVTGSYLQTVSYGYGSVSGQGSAWFGPSAPMRPSAPPEVAGRQFDYPVGFNLDTRPRAYQPIGFRDLRALADGYDLLRLAIETRKDQISRMAWSIRNRDEKTKDAGDPRVKALTAFFRRPDGVNGWTDWLRPILEDLFVLDAPALYMRRDRAGRLIELVQLDGATMKPVIDDWGRTPRPYSDGSALVYPAAYQQILKGLPAVDYSTRDLLYRPRNRRIHTPYGYSPVEQITTTVNIALRRQLSTLSYFTEGNIPDMFAQVPKEWTPDQVAAFQAHFDSYFSGDVGRRRNVKFMPGIGANAFHETRQADLKGDFDEWLAKLVCFAFSISPQALTRQMNRASADTQKQMSEEEGLEPILLWLKALIDDIIAVEFNSDDLEFAWNDDDEVDAAQQMTTLSGYVSKGIFTINEARQVLGKDPLDDPEASQAMIITGSGAVPLGSFAQQQEQSAANAKLMADAQAKQPAAAIGADGKPVPQLAAPKVTAEDEKELGKYSPDQARESNGRFAARDDSSQAKSPPIISTGVKLAALALGTALVAANVLNRVKPYKRPGLNAWVSAAHADSKAAAYMRDLHARSVTGQISKDEKHALKRYSLMDGASKVNKSLRLGRKPNADVAHIDSALSKSSLADDLVVYRGINKDRSKRLIDNTAPGETVVDKGFYSTSISEDMARHYAGGNTSTGQLPDSSRGYVMSINVDKGANALPLTEGHTIIPNQHEVLLPRSSAYRILRVDHDTKTIYAHHVGVDMNKMTAVNFEKAAPVALTDDELEARGQRFLTCDDDLEFFPAPQGDTTAEDYADYVPPQPDEVGKAYEASEARDPHGEWTSGGADASSQDAKDWHDAKEAAFAVAKGVALVTAASFAVAFAPEIAAVIGESAAAEAGIVTVAGWAGFAADGAFFEAAIKSGKVVLRTLGVNVDEIDTRLKSAIGVAKGVDDIDTKLRQALLAVTDHMRDELVADLERRHQSSNRLPTVVAAIDASADKFKARFGPKEKVAKRRLGTGWRTPEPVPFDRPSTAKAEKTITSRLTAALDAMGRRFAISLRKADKLAKAVPEDMEDRANLRADEILDTLDMSLLQDHAGDIGDDLEPVVTDAVSRAVAQIGPDNADGLTDQVNDRAVKIARERAAEMVGMHYDASGNLVPSPDTGMTITDSTRAMLRQTIADGLAAGESTDDIAEDIAKAYAFSPERAAVIAATEVSRANSMASLESYQAAAEAGVTVRKAWLTAPENCCDLCAKNEAAGPIDLNDTFPSGDDTPPGHPKCRCSLTPVVGERDTPDDE